MGLLRKDPRRRRGLPRAYATLRCPLNGHQVCWCRGLCQPVGRTGLCGRLAPHAMIGRTQAAIASQRERSRSRN
jgi:hypothetical protein